VLPPVVLLTLLPGTAGPGRVGPAHRAAVDATLRRHRAGRAARDTCSTATTTTSRHPGAAPAAADRGKATATATAPHSRADTATAHGRRGTATAAHTSPQSRRSPTNRSSSAAPRFKHHDKRSDPHSIVEIDCVLISHTDAA
jgi:hypothetical protein